jgi:hypothetical protein
MPPQASKLLGFPVINVDPDLAKVATMFPCASYNGNDVAVPLEVVTIIASIPLGPTALSVTVVPEVATSVVSNGICPS